MATNTNMIRIGRVSSVNAAAGMIQVVYTDRSGSTTSDIPYFSFNDEYKMPQKEQMVLVLHFSNGSAAGVVLGKFWNDVNKPAETGENLFRKELGNIPGQAYIKCVDGAVEIFGSSVKLSGGGSITVADLIAKLNNYESRISRLEDIV